MNKPRLGVNIDHVATLRRLRDTRYPDILTAANLCIKGGADQITVHLREDRRHIQDHDVLLLKENIDCDLNLEMAATSEMFHFALKVKPHSVCIVPEKREERTTEGGLDLSQKSEFLKEMSEAFNKSDILVSYFIEPSLKDIELSQALGAKAVELHTGTLCTAIQSGNASLIQEQWKKLTESLTFLKKTKLLVHAGHGIDLPILKELVQLKEIKEYNIGHAIVCDAVFFGIEEATRNFKKVLNTN